MFLLCNAKRTTSWSERCADEFCQFYAVITARHIEEVTKDLANIECVLNTGRTKKCANPAVCAFTNPEYVIAPTQLHVHRISLISGDALVVWFFLASLSNSFHVELLVNITLSSSTKQGFIQSFIMILT